MRQVNEGTGWRRKLMRRQNPHYISPSGGGGDIVTIQIVVPQPSKAKRGFFKKAKSGGIKLQVQIPNTGGKKVWVKVPDGAKPGTVIQCKVDLSTLSGAGGSAGGSAGSDDGASIVRKDGASAAIPSEKAGGVPEKDAAGSSSGGAEGSPVASSPDDDGSTTKEAMWEDTDTGLMNFAQFQTALAQMKLDDAASASRSGAAEQDEPVFESTALAGSVSE